MIEQVEPGLSLEHPIFPTTTALNFDDKQAPAYEARTLTTEQLDNRISATRVFLEITECLVIGPNRRTTRRHSRMKRKCALRCREVCSKEFSKEC